MRNAQPSDLTQWENASHPIVSMSKEYPPGHAVAWHQHQRGQLIYASAGVMKLRTHHAYWQLPPMRGVWMPPGTEHAMTASTAVSLRTLYVNVGAFSAALSQIPSGIAVSNLLRELLLRAGSFPTDYPQDGFEARLLTLALDEMKASTENGVSLPTGRDRRLQKVCDALIENPGDPRPLSEWARVVGATTRTLSRLFATEIGLSFMTWREQLRILDAVPQLLAGERICHVAADQGYSSQSAFTAMFKRVTGKTPSHYLPHSSPSR